MVQHPGALQPLTDLPKDCVIESIREDVGL